MAGEKEELGALWLKTSGKGTQYYSGKIKVNGAEYPVVAFFNTKTKDTHPDIRIYLSEQQQAFDPSGQNQQQLNNVQQHEVNGQTYPEYPTKEVDYPEEDIDPNDIPF